MPVRRHALKRRGGEFGPGSKQSLSTRILHTRLRVRARRRPGNSAVPWPGDERPKLAVAHIFPLSLALKTDAKCRQQTLQDGGETHENDQKLQQVRQPSIAGVSVDEPEHDRAD